MSVGIRITWGATQECLRADRRRLRELVRAGRRRRPACGLVSSSYVCVWLHRMAHYAAVRDHGLVARVLAGLNHFLTGADITPRCSFGAGLVILNPVGITLQGAAGRNLTVSTMCGLGGAIGRQEDVGGGPGLPCLGDDVVLDPHSVVLGPTRIGAGVHVSSGCVVTRDLPTGTIVEPHRLRVRRKDPRS